MNAESYTVIAKNTDNTAIKRQISVKLHPEIQI